MQTPRTVLQIDDKDPGTEIAAETAAALAASSIVFRHVDNKYARQLLNKAKLVCLLINNASFNTNILFLTNKYELKI